MRKLFIFLIFTLLTSGCYWNLKVTDPFITPRPFRAKKGPKVIIIKKEPKTIIIKKKPKVIVIKKKKKMKIIVK